MAQLIGTRLSRPADLLHRTVKQNRVAVRVAHRCRVLDTRVKLGRNRFPHRDAVATEKIDRVFQLAIIRKLDAERGAFGMRTQFQRSAQAKRQESE